jgi:HNH endonuclease
MRLTDKQLQAFWAKVDIKGKGDCWEWTAGTQSKGYGSFSVDGKTYNAHRISFMLANGYMPRLLVLHSCDNRRCVNPNHLSEGTQLENVRDMHQKGRANMSGLLHRKLLTGAQNQLSLR